MNLRKIQLIDGTELHVPEELFSRLSEDELMKLLEKVVIRKEEEISKGNLKG